MARCWTVDQWEKRKFQSQKNCGTRILKNRAESRRDSESAMNTNGPRANYVPLALTWEGIWASMQIFVPNNAFHNPFTRTSNERNKRCRTLLHDTAPRYRTSLAQRNAPNYITSNCRPRHSSKIDVLNQPNRVCLSECYQALDVSCCQKGRKIELTDELQICAVSLSVSMFEEPKTSIEKRRTKALKS